VDSATYLSAITLGQVTGVDINDPQDNQVLSYNASSGDWVNSGGGGSINGITDNTTGSPVLTLADNLITLSPGVGFSLGDDLDLNSNDITGSGSISVSGQARFERSGSPYVAINEENGKVYSWYAEFNTSLDARMVKVGNRGQRMNGSSDGWRADNKTGIIMSDNTYLGSGAGFTFLVGRSATSTSGTTITVNKAEIESTYPGRLVNCLDQLVANDTAGWEVRNRDFGNSINATVTSATTDGTDYTINLDTDVGTSSLRELEFFCAWKDFGDGSGVSSSSGPTFYAFDSVGQSVLSYSANGNAFFKMSFDSESWDSDGAYDTASSTFNPQTAGYYHITAHLQQTSVLSSNMSLLLYKNGSEYAQLAYNGGAQVGGSILVPMNGSTDILEVYVYSATTFSAQAGSGRTKFLGMWVREL
jgi:hypothetical protein